MKFNVSKYPIEKGPIFRKGVKIRQSCGTGRLNILEKDRFNIWKGRLSLKRYARKVDTKEQVRYRRVRGGVRV